MLIASPKLLETEIEKLLLPSCSSDIFRVSLKYKTRASNWSRRGKRGEETKKLHNNKLTCVTSLGLLYHLLIYFSYLTIENQPVLNNNIFRNSNNSFNQHTHVFFVMLY